MNLSNPNPMLRALANEGASGDHPDPDLLTAFAEESLLAREREAVMGHLARCAACRQVLNLSAVALEPARELELVAAAVRAPVAASTARTSGSEEHQPHSKMRVWLPWVAAAACIAIVSVVALRFAYNKPEQIASAPPSKMVAVNAPPPVAVPAPAAQPPQQRASAKAKGTLASPTLRIPAGTAGSQNAVAAAPQSSAQQAAALEPATAQSEEIAADSLKAGNAQLEQEQRQIAQQESTRTMALQEKKMESARELAPQPAAPNAPALAGAFAKTANASLVTRPHWRIDDAGHLERAFGNGPWEPALTSESARMHVVSVVAGDVWAGGENDVLYRSYDEGATWLRVALPQKNGAGHVIVHIRFDSATSGTIEAEDGTTWTTTDGGTTWN